MKNVLNVISTKESFWLSICIIFSLSLTIIFKLLTRKYNQSVGYDVFYEISLSLLSSFIFYYIVVYVPEWRRKNHLNPFIRERSLNVIGDAKFIYREMAKYSGVQEDFSEATDKDVDSICKSIEPFGDSPSLIKLTPRLHAKWITYLLERKNRSLKFIQDLLICINFLEAKHIQLLIKVRDTSYFFQLEFIHNLYLSRENIKMDNLDTFAKPLKDYFSLIKELENHLKTEKLF
jgi:hypothetical protein